MKPIAKILVPVTGAQSDTVALATAFCAARPFNAHVEAVLAHPDPQAAVPQVGVPFSLDVVEAIVRGQEEYARAAETATRGRLAELCGETGARLVEAPECADRVTCSLRNDRGALAAIVPYRARLGDLVVFPPMPCSIDETEAFLNVLTGAERPVLVSSDAPSGRLARSVAIGWDGSRPAARAVSAALPFLRGAERVHVIEVHRGRSPLCDDGIERYLDLHGVRCTRHKASLDAPSVGDMLAEEAACHDADLLVMGGYGHSHLRETFFGGVTSDVLARARMPVFLAH
ncbi:MAG TPA: universal stress protein [Rhizomicrobium sp.]|nr:universal stress protein [Rhizomicrobium sp.]